MARSIQQLFDLSGRNALLAGGARGPLLPVAHALGEAGARVMLAGCDADALEQAVAELQAVGIDARWVAADPAREAGIAHLVSETLQRMGDIHILVNTALAAFKTHGHPTDMRQLEGLSQAVVGASMARRGGGRIIHLAAMAQRDALIDLTQRQAIAWGPSAITVNSILSDCACGVIGAATLAALEADPPATRQPSQQLAGEDDLTGVALLFASDAGQHITGQCLAVGRAVGARKSGY